MELPEQILKLSGEKREKDINRLKEEEGAHEEVDIQSEEGRGADG